MTGFRWHALPLICLAEFLCMQTAGTGQLVEMQRLDCMPEQWRNALCWFFTYFHGHVVPKLTAHWLVLAWRSCGTWQRFSSHLPGWEVLFLGGTTQEKSSPWDVLARSLCWLPAGFGVSRNGPIYIYHQKSCPHNAHSSLWAWLVQAAFKPWGRCTASTRITPSAASRVAWVDLC